MSTAATPSEARLDAARVAAPLGPVWCRAWTATVDDALRGWLTELQAPPGVAVVALGSYARGELCPSSDVDLLLLHSGWGEQDLADLVRGLCYPLWDAGLSVGHAVHTPKQALRAATARVDTATALLDRRLIAGSPGLLDELGIRVARWLRRNGGRLLIDLAAADRERHAVGPGLLEPDLKAGAGGLRDLQSLRWASACLLGEPTLDALVGARYLGARDLPRLRHASDTLLAARCALHLVATGDRLRLDLQDEVARGLGLDADTLLRQVGLATRAIAHLHGQAWPRLLADARGGRRRRKPPPAIMDDDVLLVDGLIELAPGASLATDPSLGLRAVAAAAEQGTHLSRAAADRLAADLASRNGAPLPWYARGRAALLAALRRGRRALPALRDADQVGLLSAHLPGWERVRGTPQRNPLHRFDLDTHAFETVAELVAIADGELDLRHARMWEELDEPEVVLLGALLHDVGKAWPEHGDHSAVGAGLARGWVSRMGFDERRAEAVARLVRLHLLLPRAATDRDLDDPAEVAAVAKEVGDVALLDGLYLLSLADARATGPAAHSPWKDDLLAELHARARSALIGDQGPQPTPPGDPRLAGLPARYARSASAEQAAAHLALVATGGHERLRAAFRLGPADGTLTLSVVAPDRRGLVADCAGVLAGHGLEVLDARVFTRDDGVAFDWFVVRDRDRATNQAVDLQAVLADLASADAGALDVPALVARREARRDERPPRLAEPVPVEVAFDRRPRTTRIEVSAPDAPGVLYRLAAALAAAGLDVVGARVATLGPQVRDVFFVRHPEEVADQSALAAQLRTALAPAEGVSTR